LQPRHGLGAGHAAVHHPDAARLTVAALHRVDDLLDRGDVVTIAGEHLVAQRDALARHHQPDADLFAVGPMVTTVAAPGEWMRRRFALKVGACHVVEQQFVIQRKEFAQPLLQMPFERRLVR
jgi:hypothetical protein